jgi:hypothetical protein
MVHFPKRTKDIQSSGSEVPWTDSNQEPLDYKLDMLSLEKISKWQRTTLPIYGHVGQTGVDRVWGVALQTINYGGLCCLTIQVYHAIDTFRNVAGCCTLVQTVHKEVQRTVLFTHHTHSVTNLSENLICLQQYWNICA